MQRPACDPASEVVCSTIWVLLREHCYIRRLGRMLGVSSPDFPISCDQCNSTSSGAPIAQTAFDFPPHGPALSMWGSTFLKRRGEVAATSGNEVAWVGGRWDGEAVQLLTFLSEAIRGNYRSGGRASRCKPAGHRPSQFAAASIALSLVMWMSRSTLRGGA